MKYFLSKFSEKLLLFSIFFEKNAKFSKNNSFTSFSKKWLHKNWIYDKKSTILDVFVKILLKIRQSRKIVSYKQYKMGNPGHFFVKMGDLDFGIHLLRTNWYSKIEVLLYHNIKTLDWSKIFYIGIYTNKVWGLVDPLALHTFVPPWVDFLYVLRWSSSLLYIRDLWTSSVQPS